MKRYKLLKDLPTFKAGKLAYVSERGNLIAGTPNSPETTDAGIQLMIYHKTTIDKFPEILTEWFEEIQESTDSVHWNPMIGEKCFILENANIIPTLFTGKLRDYNAWRTGKIFRTEEECEKARDRELAEARLRQTSTFKPNLKKGRDGYIVVYDQMLCVLDSISCSYKYGQVVHYETKEDAQKSIKENREDWLIYFGIEEGNQCQ